MGFVDLLGDHRVQIHIGDIFDALPIGQGDIPRQELVSGLMRTRLDLMKDLHGSEVVPILFLQLPAEGHPLELRIAVEHIGHPRQHLALELVAAEALPLYLDGRGDAVLEQIRQQLLDVKDGEKTEDDFCRNVAWGISASTDNDGVLYFALGKRTDDGRYLEGQYGPDQLGVNKNYNPTELQDYIITYDNATGYCTIEWSIPLSNFLAGGGGVGSELQFTLWANAGTSTVPDDFSGDSGAIYGVVLGDFGFMVNQKSMINNVKYLLTADELAGDPVPVPDPPVPGPTPTPTPTPVDPDNPNPAPNPDNSGNGGDNGSGSGNGNANNGGNGTAPRTGDPMIIMAAVAAVSAAGAFIVGKKRH